MYLFYGCRRSNEDFLYKNEWPAYEAELDGKFIMRTAFSREMTKPDGGKVYVQDQLWDEKDKIAPLILDKRAYVYICGDAHSMSKAVEAALSKMLGESKGGDSEAGAKELKLLKDRNVSLLVQKHRPELTFAEAQDGCLELGCRDKGSLRFSFIHNNICIQFNSLLYNITERIPLNHPIRVLRLYSPDSTYRQSCNLTRYFRWPQ
jgi:hypothetical protein